MPSWLRVRLAGPRVDPSALVKLIVEEPESEELERHLRGEPLLATSRIALVEVLRLITSTPGVRLSLD
jgi:uncharacterized protein with PIN domain